MKKNFSYKKKKVRRLQIKNARQKQNKRQKGAGGAEEAAKKMDGLQSSIQSMNKSPMSHLMDSLLYTLYTLAGVFIYYPSFLINLPDSTLEQIIPTEDGCKVLFGNELVCKRKLKCFFKKCSMLEDPIGFKLLKDIEQSKQSGKAKNYQSRKIQKIQLGGKNKTRKYRDHPYMKYVPFIVKKAMKKAYKQQVRQYKKLLKQVMYDKKKSKKEEIKQQKRTDKQHKRKKDYPFLNSKKYQKGGSAKLMDMTKSQLKENVKDELQNMGTPGSMDKLMDIGTSKMTNMAADQMKNMAKGELQNMGTPGSMDKLIDMGTSHMKNMAKGELQNMGIPGPAASIINSVGQKAFDILSHDPSKNLNQETCINKTTDENGNPSSNHILCNSRPPIDYKNNEKESNILMKTLFGKTEEERQKETTINATELFSTVLGLSSQFQTPTSNQEKPSNANGNALGGTDDTEEAGFSNKDVVKEFIETNMEGESVYKLLMVYKMLEQIFHDEINTQEMEQYQKDLPDEMYGIDVAFPWSTKNQFISPEERRKCLLTHLTSSNLGDDYKSNDLYEKCFVCKNCTLANTSIKAWDKMIRNLFSSPKTEFVNIAFDLFQIMKKNFRFQLFPMKQYYLLSLLSMYFVHPMIDVNQVDVYVTLKDGTSYALKDFMLGIPQMTSIVKPSPMVLDQLRNIYMVFKMLDFDTILYSMCYKMLYKDILKVNDSHAEKRLHEIKKQIFNTSKLFYGNRKLYGLLENSVDLHELDKLHFLNTSKTLHDMNSNLDSYSEEQITKALNEQLQEYIPLFELLLDTEEYEDVEKYEKNQNTIVQSFVPIVEKLNEIERIEKEKMEENEQLI